MNNQYRDRASLSKIKRLLSWPSGSISAVLAQCPSEHNYYCGLGILVWFNSLLAGCGMALMLEQTSGSAWKALAGGAFWFLCVLNLDRFLLVSSYDNSGWKKMMPVARVLLSLCLAIIIGEHVVQFIFRNEINYQLAKEGLEVQQFNYTKALAGFPEIGDLIEERKRKQSEIERKDVEVSKLREDYIREAEGTAGSGIRGKGPLYEQKQRDYETALVNKRQLETELQEINNRLEAKNKQLRDVVNSANAAKAGDRGFLAYHRALFEIIKHDFTLLFLYIVISSAMILFEITPLISKLSGKGRLHDHIAEKELAFRKDEADAHHEAQLQDLKSESDGKAKFAQKVLQLQLDTLDEVADSIRDNTCSGLTQDKANLAESIKSYVYCNIIGQVTQQHSRTGEENADTQHDKHFDSNNPSTVTVYCKADENEEPFTIVFRQPKDKVQGCDLIYALAGLEQQRPASTDSRVPLHECWATNDQGRAIDPNKPLFLQIRGSNSVYLSAFEPAVSNAEN